MVRPASVQVLGVPVCHRLHQSHCQSDQLCRRGEGHWWVYFYRDGFSRISSFSEQCLELLIGVDWSLIFCIEHDIMHGTAFDRIFHVGVLSPLFWWQQSHPIVWSFSEEKCASVGDAYYNEFKSCPDTIVRQLFHGVILTKLTKLTIWVVYGISWLNSYSVGKKAK